MFDELDAYLEQAATPEQRILCMDACETLLLLGEERHVEAIDNELTTVDTIGSDVVVNVCSNILLPLYQRVLDEYGISISDETPLHLAVDMLKGLLLLDNYDNPDAIRDLCQTDEDIEPILAELIVLGGRYRAEDYLQHIVKVSPELLSRIEESCGGTKVSFESDALPAVSDVLKARERLKVYIDNVGEGSDFIKQALEDGMRLGLPFHILFPAHAEYLRSVADTKPERSAIYLVGLLLASNMPKDLMEGLADQFSEHTFTEVEASVKFRNTVLKVLSAVNSGS